jgi:hypothetical protein
MALCINLNDLKCEFQVEESRAGLAHDFLPDHGSPGGPGRRCVRRRHAPIRRGLREASKRSRQVHRGSPRTARIRHRSFTSLSSTRKAAQLERDDSLFQQHVLRRRLA